MGKRAEGVAGSESESGRKMRIASGTSRVLRVVRERQRAVGQRDRRRCPSDLEVARKLASGGEAETEVGGGIGVEDAMTVVVDWAQHRAVRPRLSSRRGGRMQLQLSQ